MSDIKVGGNTHELDCLDRFRWFGRLGCQYYNKKQCPDGIIWNIIVGIIGALAGSWILGLLGVTEPLTFSFITFLVAVGGAVVLLLVFNLIRGRGRR
jgi:uncharacterized membrane protein YeaQ/YmgE (transglycosylase-associated protein family)